MDRMMRKSKMGCSCCGHDERCDDKWRTESEIKAGLKEYEDDRS